MTKAEPRSEDAISSIGEVSTPTLTLWGNADQAIGRRSTELASDYMKGPYRFVELDAGHWLIQEEPERVLGEVVAHLRAFPLDPT